LEYILSLDCWTDLEKQNYINYASLHQKGVDRILRIFNTEGSKELRLKYNDSYKPVSEVPDFGKIVEHIVRRGFDLLPGKSQITTRTTFSEIRDDVKEWLPPVKAKSKSPRPTEFYLENLSYNVSPDTNEDVALIAICEEVKRISKGGAYRQYPLASSYLTRALIEQSCKRYLKTNDNAAYGRLCPSNRDSSLGKILQYFCNNPALFPDTNYHRVFVGLFPIWKRYKGHDGFERPSSPPINAHWDRSGRLGLRRIEKFARIHA
jgi:hypothetical protein